jgi:hypothetical protein
MYDNDTACPFLAVDNVEMSKIRVEAIHITTWLGNPSKTAWFVAAERNQIEFAVE